jgi:hypothetical protein
MKKYFPYILLTLIILFNLHLYRGEFKVLSDPNDNSFHFALIDDAKQIWKEVLKGKLSPIYLLDSWNERWAEGFSLSQYYSHLPEAAISLLSFIVPIPPFKLFVIIRTLLLILLPVSFFLGAIILGYTPIFGVIFAFFSQAIFTDGLYGLDSPSFLWRGWGLFTQLLAVAILPIAFAYGVSYFKTKKNLGKAILFNFLLAQAHFGMFYLLLFAYPVYSLVPDPRSGTVQGSAPQRMWSSGKRILILLSYLLVSLAYFIVPFFTTSQYRNFSLWDPIWKFNSWGLNQIIIWFGNGDLFDFNRFPFLTILIIGGVFWGLVSSNKFNRYLVLVFSSYFILFLGRDVLGPLISFIPGMSEYHIHRVIVMVQFTGLLIASGWVLNLFQSTKKFMDSRLHGNDTGYFFIILLVISLGLYFVYLIEKPIVNYVKDNDIWITRSNNDYQKNISDYQTIVDRLKKLPPARVYAGRPGNWGRNFKIGDTQIYMALSQDGFPTIGFLPESWSPNSDAEQFFDEENSKHYDLYNVGYLVLPVEKKAPQFANLIINKGKFSLYKVESEGWYTLGQSNLQVTTNKNNLVNIAHLWFNSPAFINKNYPVIALNNEKFTFVNQLIKMYGQNSFDKNMPIWRENPMYGNQEKFEQTLINKTEKKFSQGYSVNFKLKNQCQNCILILKQTFHPNWEITVNGKKQKSFPVFPFYTAIQLNSPGNYQIIATYQPSSLKVFLLVFSVIIFISFWRFVSTSRS